MPDAPAESAAPRRWQKWFVAALGLLVVVHSALLMLWLAPSSPVRDAVGNHSLASYVDPYFQQGHDAVGPNAQFVDETFRIRALVRNGGDDKAHKTEWLDLAEIEEKATRLDLDPARVHLIGRRLAANLNLAMFRLSPDQRKAVTISTGTGGLGDLRAKLLAAGSDDDAVQNYLAYDQMATQFASLYAAARWEGKVLQVQYLVGRRTVPPFADRATTTLRDVDYLWFAFGWRRAYRGSADAQSAFDSYVKK